MMDGLLKLFEKHQQNGLVKFVFDTKLFFGKLD